VIAAQSELAPETARLKATVLRYDRLGEFGIAASISAISLTVIVLHCVAAFRNDWQTFNVWIIALLVGALAICAVRVWLSKRPEFPEFKLGVLTVVEVSLFLFLIWSYQFAHDHPASGVLKSPSIVFLFVLIGVRAMRFHPLPAIVTGVSVCLGWILLTVEASVLSKDASGGITTSYDAYLSGNYILIGAEIEKLIGFAALTVVIAFAVSRARELIARTAQIDALIEARQRAELLLEKAEAAGRAKSDFLANMSHELRTPLNAIGGFSDLMIEEVMGPIEPPVYKNYLGDIRNSSQHLLGIVTDILDVCDQDRSPSKLNETHFNLRELVTECCRIVDHGAEDHGNELRVDPHSLEGEMFADRKRIKQVLINLAGNAVKFTPSGGIIVVAWDITSTELILKVSDTGIGIPKDKLASVVEPFQQVEAADARSYGGVGLGLAIVKQIAESHDGKLVVASALGMGTTVSVALPIFRWSEDPTVSQERNDASSCAYEDAFDQLGLQAI